MERQQALTLLKSHIKTKNLIKHCLACEVVLGALAERLGGDAAEWRLAGLLHDVDYDETVDSPETHAYPGARVLEEAGVSAEVVHAVLAHADKAPRESALDKALWCTDPLTGLIVAAALIRPEKKLAAIDADFVLNRFKEKGFAAWRESRTGRRLRRRNRPVAGRIRDHRRAGHAGDREGSWAVSWPFPRATAVRTCAHGASGIHWTVHLARRAPKKAAAAWALILAGALAAGVGFHSLVAGILSLLLLAASVSEFLLPVRFRLSATGIEAKGLVFRRRMAWKDVRQVRRDPLGVKLSPFSRRSRLESYRGIYLWFGDNEPEVMAALAAYREKAKETGGGD